MSGQVTTPPPRQRILTFVAFYLPGFRGGGPIRTIANAVESLGDEFDFYVVTSDRDLGDLQPYRGITANVWCRVGKAHVFYASPAARTLGRMAQLLRTTPHDVLYLNSFFNVPFSLLPLLVRGLRRAPRMPLVLAPRGEFAAAALHIKRWKKKPFVALVFLLGLVDGVVWHASSAFERADIAALADRKNQSGRITVAPDLAPPFTPVPHAVKVRRQAAALSVCFLSRICAMKNLDFALRVLACVEQPVDFYIYGPREEPSYWSECEALIVALPGHVTVSYEGSVEHALVREAIARHDVFFVPSRGENFGHVFLESLSTGVPVLVSDRTPWRHLPQRNLGWDLPLDAPQGFARALEQAATFTPARWLEIHNSCTNFARSVASDAEISELNRRVFLSALAVSPVNIT